MRLIPFAHAHIELSTLSGLTPFTRFLFLPSITDVFITEAVQAIYSPGGITGCRSKIH